MRIWFIRSVDMKRGREMERREFLIGTGTALAVTVGSPLSIVGFERREKDRSQVPRICGHLVAQA